MIDRIIDYKKKETIMSIPKFEADIIATKDARLMYLYLYYVNQVNLLGISEEILKTGDLRYIQFLLRTFKVPNYQKFITYILNNNEDPRYLCNVLFDVKYLKEEEILAFINKIIELGNERYIFKAIYRYFIMLDLFDNNLFAKFKELVKIKLNIDIDENNYKQVIEDIFYRDNNKIDPEGFSDNCYKGRKSFIPTIIVCHINNSYASALRLFYNPESEVSSHYLIRRDGHIKQVISLDDSSWANGTSIKDSSDVYYRFATTELVNKVEDNANYYTFSIEFESFDGSLTEEQLSSAIKVMQDIIRYVKETYDYDFIIDRTHIIGHNEINPIVRPYCPGEKFPFDEIIKKLKQYKG